MSNAMHVAKTGLNAQNSRMQVIANNLANVNTTGFKRDRANFETLLYQVIKASGAQTSGETKTNSAFSVGTGVRIINADKLFSQGNIVSTDNALDVSIDGSGFFQILMPDGRIGFTRNGAFGRNAEGLLTTASGSQTSGETKTNSAFSVGTGVRIINADKLFSQGNIVSTDNALDVSIDGSGFFQILMPDGRIGFTRNGAFGRNAEGLLTTASGYVVQPEIAIPEGVTNINISADGIVSVQNPGEVEAEEVGQFQLADFPNARGLQPIGQSMLVETPASGPPVVANPFENGFGSLTQGALESSNVNVVQELVDMIETQRAYEVNSKAISGVDDMLRFISQNL